VRPRFNNGQDIPETSLIARFPRLERLVTRYLQGDQNFIEEEDEIEIAESKRISSGGMRQFRVRAALPYFT